MTWASPIAAQRMAAIEAACIAGHLGEWRPFQSAVGAYERGLTLAASRCAAIPDAPCHASHKALHAEALSQAIAEAGIVSRNDTPRAGVMDCFNALNSGADLAGELAPIGAQLAPAAEQPSSSRHAQPIAKYWPSGWAKSAPHTQPHRSR